MRQPQGFVEKGKEDYVWRLIKALYGLKQAGLEWYKLFSGYLKQIGFKQLLSDPCYFIHYEKNLELILYVDDCGIAGSDEDMDWLEDKLEERFQIKRLGEIKWMLGMEIIHQESAILLSQELYI